MNWPTKLGLAEVTTRRAAATPFRFPQKSTVNVEKSYAILVWNPRAGYKCSACSWTKRAHVQDRLPGDDELHREVRKEFADHVRESHPLSESFESRSKSAASTVEQPQCGAPWLLRVSNKALALSGARVLPMNSVPLNGLCPICGKGPLEPLPVGYKMLLLKPGQTQPVGGLVAYQCAIEGHIFFVRAADVEESA